MAEWKSLESKIREVARLGLQKKINEAQAKIRLTTKVMEEPIDEEVDGLVDQIDDANVISGDVSKDEEIKEAILNSNSSGQGYDPEHDKHEYHATLQKHGYKYSHTTPIHRQNGSVYHSHTYKHERNNDKNVSVHPNINKYEGAHRWVAGTGGLARRYTGYGPNSLDKYLKNRKVVTKEEVEIDEAIKTMRSHAAYGRFLSEHPEVGYVARHHISAPSPYRSSPTDVVMKHKGKNVVVREVAHRKYEVHEVPAHAKVHKDSQAAEDEHIATLKQAHKNEEVGSIEELQLNPMKQKMDAQRAQVEKQKGQLRMQLAQQKAAKQEQAMKAKGEKQIEKIKEDEEDRIDEISKGKLGKYVEKAKVDIENRMHYQQLHHSHPEHPHSGAVKNGKKIKNRFKGVFKARDRLANEEELTERQVMRVRTFGRATKLQKLHAMRYSRFAAAGDLAKAEAHRKRAQEYKRISYMALDNPAKLPH